MKWSRVVILAALLALLVPATAQAKAQSRWNMTSPDCWRYRVKEWREGEVFHADLWGLKMRVEWCTDTPPVTVVWSGPTRHLNHYENVLWNFVGYEVKTEKVLHDPYRWQFYVKAHFYGNGAYLLTDNDYPWIRMTIWRKNPTHAHYAASCGC